MKELAWKNGINMKIGDKKNGIWGEQYEESWSWTGEQVQQGADLNSVAKGKRKEKEKTMEALQ